MEKDKELCRIIWVKITGLQTSYFTSNLQCQLTAWRHKYFILLVESLPMHCIGIIFHLFVGSRLATVAESLINTSK